MTAKYRRTLPQLISSRSFLTEGGVETTLIYDKKIALPHFATIILLDSPEAAEPLRECYANYIDAALESKTGIVLETRTWRGSRPWAKKLGISTEQLLTFNRKAVSLLHDVRNSAETESTTIVISGSIGPLSDAYRDSQDVTAEHAREQYYDQFKVLVESGVDQITATTIKNQGEIKAIIRIAQEFDVSIIISFTIEHDGVLPNRRHLEDVIREVDVATGGYVTYFGINCAHPVHILPMLQTMSQDVRERIGSVRGNASVKSHEELDDSAVLDRGDVNMFASRFEEVSRLLPELKVFGGCCGTDGEHLQATAKRIIGS